MFYFNVDLPTISAREIFFCQPSQVQEIRWQEQKQNELLTDPNQTRAGDDTNNQEPLTPSIAVPIKSEDDCQNVSVLFKVSENKNLQSFNIALLESKTFDFTAVQPDKLATELEKLPDSQMAQDFEFQDKIPPVSPPTVEPGFPESVEVSPPETPPETFPETPPETFPETSPETSPETPPEPIPETPPEPIPETPPEPIPEMDWRRNSLESLQSTSERYPFIVNPTDNFTFESRTFRPFKDTSYSTLDLRFAEDNPVLNRFTFAYFPKKDQFYWVLDGNRVVMETHGMQAGVVFQGRSTVSQFTQSVIPQQRFFGLQAIWSLPPILDNLIGIGGNNNQLAVLAIAGQVNTPPGILAGNVTINNNITQNNSNATIFLPSLGSGSTNNSGGGGSLFQNLDRANAPRFIQAFPTNNLKPLLNNGVALREGAIIPTENLQAAGIGFSSLETGLGFSFTAPLTSIPGIKVGQPGGGMNPDLLNLVVNPFLSPRERDLRYLNSLFWFSLGQRIIGDVTQLDSQESSDWYRFYFSLAHKKTSIEYDSQEIQATYRSIFRNPGISVTASLDEGVDEVQFVNATLGLFVGIFFAGIQNQHIEDALEEAHTAFENGEGFAVLNTVATPEQRRQINQRLNQNLFNTERATKLQQLSGSYTFPGRIRATGSNLFQVRTGLYQRSVEFLSQDIGDFGEVATFFSSLDTSSRDFGGLGFIGTLYPATQTAVAPSNQSTAVEVTLINSNGQQFVQQLTSNAKNTIVPLIAGKAFDITFDSISIGKLLQRNIETNGFIGDLYLPSIEVVTSGTNGNFNYGASLGTWFNINPSFAGSVTNELGLKEPSFGVYAHGIANFIWQDVKFDQNNRPVAIETHSPFLDIDWNSATNRLNAFQMVTGYSFSRQGIKSGYSATGAIIYIPQGSNGVDPRNSNGEFLGLVSGQLGTGWGLGFKSNFEIGKDIFFDLELTQRIVDNFSLGVYYQNFNIINIGLDSRINDSYYGAILRYITPDGKINIDAKLGNSDEIGFDARLRSSLRFNF